VALTYFNPNAQTLFAKHTLTKHNLGRLGLRPRLGPLFFFARSSPSVRVGMDPVGPAWSLAQTNDSIGHSSIHAWTIHACILHSAKVIIITFALCNTMLTKELHWESLPLLLFEDEDDGDGGLASCCYFSHVSVFPSSFLVFLFIHFLSFFLVRCGVFSSLRLCALCFSIMCLFLRLFMFMCLLVYCFRLLACLVKKDFYRHVT